jgi:hypothetical protein
MVGVTTFSRLDYAVGTADVRFTVAEGPSGPTELATPPYAAKCEQTLTGLAWSGVDEHVPLPLVQELVSLHSLSMCFSDKALRHDLEALKRTHLFEEVSASTGGDSGFRQVSWEIRGRKLSVESVYVVPHGSVSAGELDPMPKLPLQPVAIYTRSLARESTEVLKYLCKNPNRVIDVFERVSITPDGRLRVTFHVLGYPPDQVSIGDQRALSNKP